LRLISFLPPLGCVTGHSGAVQTGAAVCIDCGTRMKVIKPSSVETAEQRKLDAESNLSFVVQQFLFVDLDWVHLCLVQEKSESKVTATDGGKLTSSRAVSKLNPVSQWMAAYRLYLTCVGVLLGGHFLFADRMNDMTFFETLLKTYTAASVIEYDRQYRAYKKGEVAWCDGQICAWYVVCPHPHSHPHSPYTRRCHCCLEFFPEQEKEADSYD
jgi:hypothetical protein